MTIDTFLCTEILRFNSSTRAQVNEVTNVFLSRFTFFCSRKTKIFVVPLLLKDEKCYENIRRAFVDVIDFLLVFYAITTHKKYENLLLRN